MSQQKNILFHSTQYDFCREIVQIIMQKGLRDFFVFIDIDQHRHRLPEFVDRVPFIVTPLRQHYTDEMVRTYVEHLSSIHSSQSRQSQQSQSRVNNDKQGYQNIDNEPVAYSFGNFQPNSVTVADYESVLDDSLLNGFPYNSTTNDNTINNNYNAFGSKPNSFIDPEKVDKGDRIPDSLYKNYLAQRDADSALFKNSTMPRMA